MAMKTPNRKPRNIRPLYFQESLSLTYVTAMSTANRPPIRRMVWGRLSPSQVVISVPSMCKKTDDGYKGVRPARRRALGSCDLFSGVGIGALVVDSLDVEHPHRVGVEVNGGESLVHLVEVGTGVDADRVLYVNLPGLHAGGNHEGGFRILGQVGSRLLHQDLSDDHFVGSGGHDGAADDGMGLPVFSSCDEYLNGTLCVHFLDDIGRNACHSNHHILNRAVSIWGIGIMDVICHQIGAYVQYFAWTTFLISKSGNIYYYS